MRRLCRAQVSVASIQSLAKIRIEGVGAVALVGKRSYQTRCNPYGKRSRRSFRNSLGTNGISPFILIPGDLVEPKLNVLYNMSHEDGVDTPVP